jgi:hypothetical protein
VRSEDRPRWGLAHRTPGWFRTRTCVQERGGKRSPDKIYGLRGNGKRDAGILIGDRDILFGGRGDDRLEAADVDGKDVVNGDPNFDVCIIDRLYGKDATRGCERVRELQVAQAS